MNIERIETLVREACSESVRRTDYASMSDAELIALGRLHQGVWTLRQGALDIEDLVDWRSFVKQMRGIFSELFRRASSRGDDMESQRVLLPALYELMYSPTLPEDKVLNSIQKLADKYLRKVISGDDVSWRDVHAAMNICEATVCQWEGCEDEVEYRWFEKVAAEWNASIFCSEPVETISRAGILQNAEMIEAGVVASIVDKYKDCSSCEVVCTLAKLCLDSYECDSEVMERVCGFVEKDLPLSDKWTLMAVVSEMAEVVL